MTFPLHRARPRLAHRKSVPTARSTELAGLTALRGVAGTAFGVLALLGLCSRELAAQPTATAGAAAPKPASSIAAGAASSGATALPAIPPSGEYEVTTSLVTNSCGDQRAAAAPLKGAVYVKTMKKGPVGNLPLPSLGPSPGAGKSATVERNDVQLTAGEKIVANFSTQPPCPSYKFTRTIELLEVTRERIKLRRTEEYGDGSGCPKPPALTKCAVTAEQVFTLQKAMCEAPCTGQGRAEQAGVITMECSCPKATGK